MVSTVPKQKWTTETLRLPKSHGWKARPGHKILVLGRGAVRLDYPAHWITVLPEAPDEISVKLHDRQPPDDNWRLEVSYLTLNPGIDFSGLPVSKLLRETVLKDDHRAPFWRSDVTEVKRPDGIEYAWAEIAFVDTNEHRVACSRACLARGYGVQPLITLDYWESDAGTIIPTWEEIMRTLQLGQYVSDPTRPAPRYRPA